jgi:hypothetical protein
MQEPTDRLTTQSTNNADEATDKPVAIPQVADGDLGGNVEHQDVATGNTETTSMPPVENRSSNEEGRKPGWIAANLPAAGFTPVMDLVRLSSDQQVNVALFTLRDNEQLQSLCDTRIQHNGRLHYVPPMPPALYRSLILPTTVQAFKSDRDLLDSIVALLRKHVMLPKNQCSLLAHWSMATWFPDFLPFIPSVVITGPAAAADLLLRTLVAVCRRPVLLADASPAVLSALPLAELMPTLLMREPQLNKRMAALLDASSQPGYLVRRNKDFQQFYCAKCVYIGEAANSQLSMPNSIHIHVGGNSRRSLSPLPTNDVIQDFQNRLLFYRILRHDDVAASKFRVPGFQFRPEVSAMAQVLGASIVNDLELQHGIIELLKERDEQSRVDRASVQDGMALKAVLWHCHQSDQQQLFVREIAATANRIYSEEGESLKISNETVGHVLKNLGLYIGRFSSPRSFRIPAAIEPNGSRGYRRSSSRARRNGF